MKCGSLQPPSRSRFREMEWKNSMDGAISYPSENPGLGFLLPISSHPLSLHFPSLSAKDVQVSVKTMAWSDLWLCAYRKRNQMDSLHVFFIYSQHK